MSELEAVCERCGDPLEPGKAYTVTLGYPEGAQVSLRLCASCGTGLRQFLYAPIEPPPEPAPEPEPSVPARAGWFALRMAAYGVIALAVFALATWLSVR